MRNLFFSLLALLALASCSTCYECIEEVVLYDGNTGAPVDTTENRDEFCTASPDEVDEREELGADCQAQ